MWLVPMLTAVIPPVYVPSERLAAVSEVQPSAVFFVNTDPFQYSVWIGIGASMFCGAAVFCRRSWPKRTLVVAPPIDCPVQVSSVHAVLVVGSMSRAASTGPSASVTVTPICSASNGPSGEPPRLNVSPVVLKAYEPDDQDPLGPVRRPLRSVPLLLFSAWSNTLPTV